TARPRHESAGMRAPAAQVEPADGCAIARSPQERPHREELVERQLAVKDVAAAESVLSLEVVGCDDLRRDDLLANAGHCVFQHAKRGVEQRVTRARRIGGPKHTRRIVDVDRGYMGAGWREA